MQRIKNLLGQVMTYARHTGQLFNAGLTYAANSAKMIEQGLTPPCPDTGNTFQRRGGGGFLASASVAGNGKTVRFVANLLHEVRGR